MLAVGLVACAGPLQPDTTAIIGPPVTSSKPPPPASLPDVSQPPLSTPPSTTLAGTIERIVEAAKSDLAGRLDIDPEDIAVVEAGEVTWRDSARGCPQPGTSYLQVLTPGYLIRLQVGGIGYEYHAGADGTPFYCLNPEPPAEGGGAGNV